MVMALTWTVDLQNPVDGLCNSSSLKWSGILHLGTLYIHWGNGALWCLVAALATKSCPAGLTFYLPNAGQETGLLSMFSTYLGTKDQGMPESNRNATDSYPQKNHWQVFGCDDRLLGSRFFWCSWPRCLTVWILPLALRLQAAWWRLLIPTRRFQTCLKLL